jgi:hypothetical protein
VKGWYAQPGGGQGVTRFTTTADQSFTSSALADVTTASFNLAAATTYNFRCVFPFLTAGSTVGLKLSATWPTAPTWLVFDMTIPLTINTFVEQAFTATGSTITATTGPLTIANALMDGTIVTNASGVMQVRAANETGTTAVTIKRGAFGWLV